jgi:DNA uptake protein ComE-like DNA-binding protein
MKRFPSIRRSRQRGIVLLIVLVSVVFLALAAYTFSALMVTQSQITKLAGRQVQSKYLVDSGTDYVRMYLAQDDASIRELGGRYDNSAYFQAISVGLEETEETSTGRFTVIAAGLDEDGNPGGFRYGLTDESTRLNLNVLGFVEAFYPGGGKQLLMALPQMTEDVADSILDWIDTDEDIRPLGAESNYYNSLNPPYNCKNGPLDTIEELLLIRGVTPDLLFGVDANHNGLVDTEEMLMPGAESIDPELELGWASYLTLYSKEHNVNADGLKRININSENLEQLATDLRSRFDQRLTDFIIAYRQNGAYTGSDEPQTNFAGELDFSVQAKTNFLQVLDLIDAVTTVTYEGTEEAVVIKSPIDSLSLGSYLPVLMNELTTQKGSVIPGRINIMQASRRLLMGIPGMTEDLLENILRYREFELDAPESADRNRQFETWLLVEGFVDLTTMRSLTPYICCGGDVYRAEVVGYFDDQIGIARAESVIDTTTPLPRVLFWRDKSHLQRGYSADTLGTALIQ